MRLRESERKYVCGKRICLISNQCVSLEYFLRKANGGKKKAGEEFMEKQQWKELAKQ